MQQIAHHNILSTVKKKLSIKSFCQPKPFLCFGNTKCTAAIIIYC